jgi:hypothetical protein
MDRSSLSVIGPAEGQWVVWRNGSLCVCSLNLSWLTMFYFILLTSTTFGGRRTIKGGREGGRGAVFPSSLNGHTWKKPLQLAKTVQNQAQTLCTCVFALGRPSVFLCVCLGQGLVAAGLAPKGEYLGWLWTDGTVCAACD